MIFEIGQKPQTQFHLLVFELAYITVPSANLQADLLYKAKMDQMKKENPKLKEVIPQIEVIDEMVGNESM